MRYLGHILECPIGPSLKVAQLRRLFDWTNMAAALPQFFGAAYSKPKGSLLVVTTRCFLTTSNDPFGLL